MTDMNAYVLLLARLLFSWFFLFSGFNHLTKLTGYAQYAGSQGVPAPTLAVAATGVMLLAGGLSILLGYKVRWGALILIVFLVPTSFFMHRFWGLADVMATQNQAAHFWKNIVIAGALGIVYWQATVHPGPWPYSVEGRAPTAARSSAAPGRSAP